PAYEDKESLKGIKFKHLFDKVLLRSRLAISLGEKETLFIDLYKVEYPTLEQEIDKLFALGQKLKQYAAYTFSIIDQAIAAGMNV
ncbi:adenylosuccinate synthetase, partial [Francisella tularensis subsp. holarctica]|uniref:adenylosuccinate synthetase n=1 Tax=Francisella tularensis TaxID=263 RepID=UPI002381BAA6